MIFIFLLFFAATFNTSLSLKKCNNVNGHYDGYCVPFQECGYFQKSIRLFSRQLPRHIKNNLKLSICTWNYMKRTICCAQKDILLLKTTTTSRTTKASTTSLPKAVRIEAGLKFLERFKDECGLIKYGSRIANGNEVDIGQYAWMALLLYDVPGDQVMCGGSLITNRHILTAAHCFESFKPIKIRLGEHNIQTEKDCLNKKCFTAIDVNIKSYQIHEHYNFIKHHNDIALITLEQSVGFTPTIQPICLQTTNLSNHTNGIKEYTIAGWGATKNGKLSNVLLETNVEVRSLKFCRQQLNVNITNRQICAGGVKLSDTCKGDSGGPLFYYNYDLSRYVQHGITSYGRNNCGKIISPSVYTNVITYMNWIAENIA